MTEPRYRQPDSTPAQRHRATRVLHGALRVLCAATALSLGALTLWQSDRVRVAEAVLADAWLGWLLDGPVSQIHDVVFFPWLGGSMIGMRISEQCTVAYLLGPMCLVAALLAGTTRSSLLRLVAGLLMGAALLVVVNQIRIAIIAESTQRWGTSGYDVSHKLVGTVIALVGFTLAASVMVVVATGHRRRNGQHRRAV